MESNQVTFLSTSDWVRSGSHLTDRGLPSIQADTHIVLSLRHTSPHSYSCRSDCSSLQTVPPHTLGERQRKPQMEVAFKYLFSFFYPLVLFSIINITHQQLHMPTIQHTIIVIYTNTNNNGNSVRRCIPTSLFVTTAPFTKSVVICILRHDLIPD